MHKGFMYLDNCKWHYRRYSDSRDIKDTNNQNGAWAREQT